MPTRHTTRRSSRVRSRGPRILGLMVLALAAVLLSLYALSTSQSGPATGVAPRDTGRAAPPSAVPEPVSVPRIEILGDSYVGSSAEGGKGLSNWTSLVGTRFHGGSTPVEINPVAQPGSGYIARGATGLVFREAATQRLSPEADVVLVFGSRNDGRQSDPVMYEAARALYSDLRTLTPKAQIVVVGPVWVDGNVPDFIAANNEAMARAAADEGVRYVDALAEGWFAGTDGSLIGLDGVHPTDAGHAYLAEKIYPLLAETVSGLRR
ncbi:SGNH/GDSL hydrolase family protein [Arthrobacter sp. Sa2CUA1]|uniref:SGNH/GDSL hydrolase family protein n=1 Tax=Arthrobacter gallicola TaxID=2762225 RepID=A0ABR8UU82_9MICC|nr:SGNH/GDSL hydrolase family protein [Arthrobacter gallicola]MBD7996089.1 SGNH/GDSL hydrolase family protein [Arthrobacter gallicola]